MTKRNNKTKAALEAETTVAKEIAADAIAEAIEVKQELKEVKNELEAEVTAAKEIAAEAIEVKQELEAKIEEVKPEEVLPSVVVEDETLFDKPEEVKETVETKQVVKSTSVVYRGAGSEKHHKDSGDLLGIEVPTKGRRNRQILPTDPNLRRPLSSTRSYEENDLKQVVSDWEPEGEQVLHHKVKEAHTETTQTVVHEDKKKVEKTNWLWPVALIIAFFLVGILIVLTLDKEEKVIANAEAQPPTGLVKPKCISGECNDYDASTEDKCDPEKGCIYVPMFATTTPPTPALPVKEEKVEDKPVVAQAPPTPPTIAAIPVKPCEGLTDGELGGCVLKLEKFRPNGFSDANWNTVVETFQNVIMVPLNVPFKDIEPKKRKDVALQACIDAYVLKTDDVDSNVRCQRVVECLFTPVDGKAECYLTHTRSVTGVLVTTN